MNRETRLNLVFLGLFLAISLPGAVMLFKKKMDPTAPPMFMPDYVRRRLPYMAPQNTSADQVVRVIPDVTGAWVTQVNRQHGGGDEVLLDDRHPIVSDDHSVQITSLQGSQVNLIIWSPATQVTIESAGQPARIARTETLPMPGEVKKELMNWGVVQPPPKVVWIEAQFAQKLTSPPTPEIVVSYRKDADDALIQSRIELPLK